jgi:phosphoribosylglycinamide formyltransferase 1
MNAIPKIAIFASGNGSNAQRIYDYFSGKGILEIAAIYCNNPEAYILERAKNLNIPSVLFNRPTFYQTQEILEDLMNRKVDWIILAGFLWLIPDYLLKAFPNTIVNIHPALLPKYGGKGMYGNRVHEAVIASGDAQSGITIHFVNEAYDEGQVIFQETCEVTSIDTPESLALKIHGLEYRYFPEVIEKIIQSKNF